MINDLLDELNEKHINITFLDGKLKYNGPEDQISQELIGRLKANKLQLTMHFWPKEAPNIYPINPVGNLMPVLMLHGGSYFQLTDDLGNGRPLYSFAYIGSETEDSKIKYKSVESFAGEYIRQLNHVVASDSFIVGGFSMGGHLAFEMALQLRKNGKNIPLVFLVDSGLVAYDKHDYGSNILKKTVDLGVSLASKVIYFFPRKYYSLKYSLFKSTFKKMSINKRTAYIVKIYDRLIARYKPQEQYDGKILLFRASMNLSSSRYLGWDKVCKNITVVDYEGNHASMFHDNDVIQLIKTHIADAVFEISKENSI
ncbi:MAG: hypothetical protein JW717_12820 [Marinilabiliaceae bacterium]|nr:hypothetical protein [Marinilabiliaceae bacterium]